MTLADIPVGASVFVDANILVFALTNHAVPSRDESESSPAIVIRNSL